jgi:hypothetical protein
MLLLLLLNIYIGFHVDGETDERQKWNLASPIIDPEYEGSEAGTWGIPDIISVLFAGFLLVAGFALLNPELEIPGTKELQQFNQKVYQKYQDLSSSIQTWIKERQEKSAVRHPPVVPVYTVSGPQPGPSPIPGRARPAPLVRGAVSGEHLPSPFLTTELPPYSPSAPPAPAAPPAPPSPILTPGVSLIHRAPPNLPPTTYQPVPTGYGHQTRPTPQLAQIPTPASTPAPTPAQIPMPARVPTPTAHKQPTLVPDPTYYDHQPATYEMPAPIEPPSHIEGFSNTSTYPTPSTYGHTSDGTSYQGQIYEGQSTTPVQQDPEMSPQQRFERRFQENVQQFITEEHGPRGGLKADDPFAVLFKPLPPGVKQGPKINRNW